MSRTEGFWKEIDQCGIEVINGFSKKDEGG